MQFRPVSTVHIGKCVCCNQIKRVWTFEVAVNRGVTVVEDRCWADSFGIDVFFTIFLLIIGVAGCIAYGVLTR